MGQVSPEGFSRGEPTLVLEVVLGTWQIWPCRGAHPICVPVPWHQARASLGDVSSGGVKQHFCLQHTLTFTLFLQNI